MSIPAFHFDGVSSDDETAFIDIIGGFVMTIERQDNGLAVSVIRWVQDDGRYEVIGESLFPCDTTTEQEADRDS